MSAAHIAHHCTLATCLGTVGMFAHVLVAAMLCLHSRCDSDNAAKPDQTKNGIPSIATIHDRDSGFGWGDMTNRVQNSCRVTNKASRERQRPENSRHLPLLQLATRQNVHNIAVLHDISLAFQSICAFCFGVLHRAGGHEVGKADDFGTDESL